MKNSRDEANKQRRLHVERLESRTVLSATNLLAITTDVLSHLDQRLELPEGPPWVASRLAATDTSFPEMPALPGEHTPLRFAAHAETVIAPRFQEVRSEMLAGQQPFLPIPVSQPRLPFDLLPPASGQPLPALPHPGMLLHDVAIASEHVSPPEFVQRLAVRDDLATLAPPRVSTLLDGLDPVANGPNRSEWIDRRESELTSGRFDPSLAVIANRAQASDPVRFVPDRLPANDLLGLGNPRLFLDADRDRLFASIGESRIELLERAPDERVQSILQLRLGSSRLVSPPESFAPSVSTVLGKTDVTDVLIDLSARLRSTSNSFAMHPVNGGNNSHGGVVAQHPQVSSHSAIRVADATLDSLASILKDSVTDSTLANRQRGFDSAGNRIRSDGVSALGGIPSRRDPLPDDDGWWSQTTREGHNSFWLEFGQDIESQLPNEVEEQSGGDASQIAEADPDVDRSEGGLVELIAAAYPAADRQAVSATHGVAPSKQSPADRKEVQIDCGVGMFHVFELAIAPAEFESGQPVTGADPPTQATAATKADEVPPAEQAAAVSDDAQPDPIRAASLPVLLVAASLFLDRRQQVDEYSTDVKCKRRQ